MAKKKEVGRAAVRVLRRFQREMNKWEWRMIKEDFGDLEDLPPEKIDAEVDKRRARSRAALKRIFEAYCEAGAKARRVADELHWGTDQPDYDPDTEELLSCDETSDRVVVIETQMAHNFQFRLRYELVAVKGKWLI